MIFNKTGSPEYYQGMKDGVSLYATWKDGTAYLGNMGETLTQALAEIDKVAHEAIIRNKAAEE